MRLGWPWGVLFLRSPSWEIAQPTLNGSSIAAQQRSKQGDPFHVCG